MSQVSEVSPREEAIIELVTTTPGIIKDEVVKRMDGQSSRVTTYKILSGLIEGGILLKKKEKPNSQTHHLYVNNKNLYVTIKTEIKKLEKFIQSMQTPIKEIIDILKKEFEYGGIEFKLCISHILNYQGTIEFMIYRLFSSTHKLHSDHLSRKLFDDIMSIFTDLAMQLDPLLDYLHDYELSAQQEEIESLKNERRILEEDLKAIETKDESQKLELGRKYSEGRNRLRAGKIRLHLHESMSEMTHSIINYRSDFKQRFEHF